MSLKGPHDSLPEEQVSKAQAMVSTAKKHAVGSVFPDRGIHAFLIQHAYEQTASFIIKNNLTYVERDRVVKFIENGFCDLRERTDSPASEHSSRGSVGSGTPSADKPTSASKNKRARTQKSVG